MNYTEKFARTRHWLPTIALCGTLVACGGGGGGSVPTPAGPTGSALALSGTAATGAAIAGKSVEAKCASGSGTSTSAADGSFTVNVAVATMPCLLRVTAADGTVLHSLAAGSGASVLANITPLTHLVVAALAAGDPASFYAGFSSSTAGSVTTTSAAAAIASVVAKLKAAGVDPTALGNLLTANLVAANGSAAGNAYDLLLDALKAKLTSSGTTLTQLTQAVVVEAKAAQDPTLASGTPSLPSDLLLQPAASTCAAVRSGVYRVVQLQAGAAASIATGTITVNASTLSLTNGTSTWSWTANGACRFSGDTGEDILVSQAGVIVARDHDLTTDPFHLTVGFPEQAHTLAELAGNWNKLGFGKASTTFAADAASATVDSGGAVSAVRFCADVKTCADVAGNPVTVTVNPAGGFDRSFADGSPPDRAFAYRAGGGELMLVTIAGDGSFGFWTHQRTNPLPVLNATNTSWDFEANNQLVSTAVLSISTNTILSVDAVTGVFTRQNSTGTVGVTRTESLVANSPRPGYRLRAAATVPLSNDGTTTVREQITLTLRGMGMTPIAYPSTTTATFGLSVAPPTP